MKLYPFQTEAVEVGVRSVIDGDNILISSPTGCHAKGTGIRLSNGDVRKIEDICAGDRLMGQFGPVTVLVLCRGRQEMARIVSETGRDFVVNLDHYLTLQCSFTGSTHGWKKGHIFDVTVREYLGWGSIKQSYCRLVRYKVVECDGVERRCPLDIDSISNDRFTIELLPVDDYYGVHVDGNHRYLLSDFTLTRNSGKSLVELVIMHEVQRSLGLTCGMITSQREIAEGIIEKGEKMGVPIKNRIWTPQKFWNQMENKRVRMPQVLIVDECLVPETPVLTPAGPRAIGELKVGDEVITPYGTPTKVTKTSRVKKLAIRLKSKKGREVICSPEHKFMSFETGGRLRGKQRTNDPVKLKTLVAVPASKLKHFVIAPLYASLRYNTPIRPDPLNYLYGWILGDGHVLRNSNNIVFGFAKDHAEFKSILTDLLHLQEGEDFTHRFCKKTQENRKPVHIFTLLSHLAVGLIERFNLPRGNKAHSVTIDNALCQRCDIDVLRGLFDAEGSRTCDRISLDMASEKIVKQMHQMLLGLGIEATYNVYERTTRDRNGQLHAPRHRLVICGQNINRFNTIVGWGLARKQKPHRRWGQVTDFNKDLIVSWEEVGEMELVDITVEDEEHYFVLNNGICGLNSHHSLAKTWQRLWKRTSYEGQPVRIVGLTATPMRGVEYENPQWKTLFHRFHEAITITEAIKQDYLSNFYILKDTVGMLGEQQILTARAQDQVAADAIEEKLGLICEIITSLDANRPTVFITPTVAAATSVATYFKYHTKIPVEPIVGTTSRNRRRSLMKKLAKNQIWCAAVNLMTEGIDIPEISRVVNLRPSVSPIPYVQGLGRGLRLIYRGERPDLSLKRWCEYIDFTNNLFRFGTKLRDVLGIRFEENEHTYTPDLDFVPEEEHKMTIVDDYINFRYSPVESKPVTAHYEGQEVVAKVGSTTGNDWAIRLFLSGNKSDVYVLERTSGLWKKKTASLQPKDFRIELGSSRDEILTLGARMGRGFKQVADEVVTLGELLVFGLLRQLVSETRELTDTEKEAYLVSRKFLTLIPGPRILAQRAS